jgi:hypothetical protein
MGSVNKPSTKLEPTSSNESKILGSLSDINGKVRSNELLTRISSPLRVIALRTETYDALRELASQGNNHKTYDGIIRKCVEAYKNKKK